ncbi:hypothetical protein J2Y46_001025 [Microbacterium sp. BE35]|nr:hypothetical protein [Microbacterium sp. BE35]
MAKIRVHELATELSVDAKVVLDRLRELGEYVKSPSSTIEAPVARKVRASYGATAPRPGAPRPPALRREHLDPHVDRPGFDPSAPSARQHGWRSGAVPAPQHPDLLANIERVRYKYPALRDHIDALRSLGSQVVYAGFCRQDGFRDCAIVHVRFSGAIEAVFGFTRDLMIFYSPDEDMQGRTFQAAARELGAGGRSVTPDIFFMWSPDQRLRIKLNDWSRPAKLAIPLLIDDEDELALITLLRDYIYARDLFYMTTPVSGASFFGRRTLLQSLRDDVFNQRVTGVFGLRKSGKTSILMQLNQEPTSHRPDQTMVEVSTAEPAGTAVMRSRYRSGGSPASLHIDLASDLVAGAHHSRGVLRRTQPIPRRPASEHGPAAGQQPWRGIAPQRHPMAIGSRSAPVVSSHTDLTSVYSCIASVPFSRPIPLRLVPPKGTAGDATR